MRSLPGFRVEFEDVKCIGQTTYPDGKRKALKIEGITEKPVCIPYSLVDEDSEAFAEGLSGTLVVPEWFAEKEGWI